MSTTTPSKSQTLPASHRRTVVAVGIVVAVTVIAGVLHGRQTHRWGTPQELLRAVHELDGSFPRTIGPWHAFEEEEMSPATLEVLHDPGYVLRSYRHRITGETVKLAVLVGPPGPMAVHSPEICYSSQAYSISTEPEAVTLATGKDEKPATFWKLLLEARGLSDPPLVVYYAWGTGDGWVAARNPRFTYGNRRFLYKLQLAAVGPPPLGRADAGQRFLQDLLAKDFHLPVAN
jgi:hypothetical protein